MADTIGEKLAQAVKTRLETVTTGNGYNNTLSVKRLTAEDLERGVGYTNNEAIIIEGADDIEEGRAQTTEERMKSFQVDVYKVLSEDDSTPVGQALNNVAGDVEKAIVSDRQWLVGADYLALNTYLRGTETSIESYEDGSSFVVSVSFQIRYRTDEDDPFALPS